MVKCPECDKEIEYLKNYQSGEDYEWVFKDEKQKQEFIPDNQINDYECPECAEVLFTDEKKALKFLNGR